MIDLDQVRKRHTRATSCCVCEETLSTYSLVCSVCGETSNNPRDPAVLALCDEVEALRAANKCPACDGAGDVEMQEDAPRWICFMCNGSGRLTDYQAAEIRVRTKERDEALARLAKAPEVLREWPARAEDAPGEWFLCLHGARAPRGEFEANGDRKPLFRDEEGDIWPAHEFEPGEFFVRAPE